MRNKQYSLYYFTQYLYHTKHMLNGVKQVNEFKSNKSKLRKLLMNVLMIF